MRRRGEGARKGVPPRSEKAGFRLVDTVEEGARQKGEENEATRCKASLRRPSSEKVQGRP